MILIAVAVIIVILLAYGAYMWSKKGAAANSGTSPVSGSGSTSSGSGSNARVKGSYSQVGKKKICPEGSALDPDGKCYIPCSDGYTAVDGQCVKSCSAGLIDRNGYCVLPEDTISQEQYERSSRTPDLKSCGNFRDDGSSCILDPDTVPRATYSRSGFGLDDLDSCGRANPQGCQQDGNKYYGWCKYGFNGIAGTCVADTCPDGYMIEGASCKRIGYGIKSKLADRQYCKDTEDLINGLCYPKCKTGFEADTEGDPGSVVKYCIKKSCPDGYTASGKSCIRAEVKKPKVSYTRIMAVMLCPVGTNVSLDDLCYEPCKDGFSGSGALCTEN